MFTGVFRDRTRLQRLAGETAHQSLHRLIHSRPLLPFRPVRQCEIGPFVVEYAFREHGLIVELEPPELSALPRAQARAAFLQGMGYRVLLLPRRQVRHEPQRVLEQIRLVLRTSSGWRPITRAW